MALLHYGLPTALILHPGGKNLRLQMLCRKHQLTRRGVSSFLLGRFQVSLSHLPCNCPQAAAGRQASPPHLGAASCSEEESSANYSHSAAGGCASGWLGSCKQVHFYLLTSVLTEEYGCLCVRSDNQSFPSGETHCRQQHKKFTALLWKREDRQSSSPYSRIS